MNASTSAFRLTRLLTAFVLLIVSGVLIAPILIAEADPVESVQLDQSIGLWASRFVILVLGGFAIWMIAWPPALPWLRVEWRRFRTRGLTDTVRLHESLTRLKNFENSADLETAARCFEDLGRTTHAIQAWHRAVELDPSSVTARAGVARCLAKLGRHADAAEQYAMVLKAEPDHDWGKTLRQFARSLYRSGRLTDAAQALEDHEAMQGADRRADLLRVRVYGELGRQDEARRFRDRAARPLDPQEKVDPELALTRAQARVARIGGAR